MTTPSQISLIIACDADRTPEGAHGPVFDDSDMHRFIPPHSPLPMPQQDLTPRVSLRHALSVIGLTLASR